MEILIALILLLLFLATLIWWHLFYRSTFTPPAKSKTIQIEKLQGVPYFLENELPYPAGIRTTNRKKISLTGVWDFHLEGENGTSPVKIPACFNTADSPLPDYQGLVWYEKEFTIPEWSQVCTLSLTFLGSFQYTQVWLDKNLIGSNEGSYPPLYFDISQHVKPGKRYTIFLMAS